MQNRERHSFSRSGRSLRPARPVADALMIAGGYAVVAALWILFSDRLLVAVVANARIAATVSEIKGELFVVVTAALLFWVINRYLARLRTSEDRFVEAQAEIRVKELAVRQGYVDVLDAVTGGKLILITEDELPSLLGDPLMAPRELVDPKGLSAARAVVAETIAGLPVRDPASLILAASEALTNAVKHGRRGEYGVYRSGDCLQVLVRDFGPGIDFRALPKATLIQGFSTTNTMGLGFTIMLEVCDRVLLTTSAHGTIVILELELAGASSSPSPRSLATIFSESQRIPGAS